MANRFFGLNRGANINTPVTEGSSTGSTDVEVRVDDSKALTKSDVALLLEAIVKHIDDVNTTIPDA